MPMTDEEKLRNRVDKLTILNQQKDNETKRLIRKLGSVEQELEDQKIIADELRRFREHKPAKLPKWLTESKSTKKDRATAVQMFSDTHYEEVVLPEAVNWQNAFNPSIAEMRQKKVVTSSIKLTKHYTSGIDFESVVLAFLGDHITGAIHRELDATNAMTRLQAAVAVSKLFATSIAAYANAFDKVFCPVVVGNHPRLTAHFEHKSPSSESIDWLVYTWLENEFKDNDQVVFYIPDSQEVRFKLYNTYFMATHGYNVTGGSPKKGSTGKLVAHRDKILSRDSYKSPVYTPPEFSQAPVDWILTAHYHTAVFENGIMQNGCLKGVDEYAFDIACRPERPSQTLFFVTPQHGVTVRMPVYADSKSEKPLWDKVRYRSGEIDNNYRKAQ